MMGQQCRKESLFYYFRLEDQVPETHLLRLIDRYRRWPAVSSAARLSAACRSSQGAAVCAVLDHPSAGHVGAPPDLLSRRTARSQCSLSGPSGRVPD
jgi:hypothetical protein